MSYVTHQSHHTSTMPPGQTPYMQNIYSADSRNPLVFESADSLGDPRLAKNIPRVGHYQHEASAGPTQQSFTMPTIGAYRSVHGKPTWDEEAKLQFIKWKENNKDISLLSDFSKLIIIFLIKCLVLGIFIYAI
eukprot:UN28587